MVSRGLCAGVEATENRNDEITDRRIASRDERSIAIKETKLVIHPVECNIEFLLDRQLELALFNLRNPAG